VFTCGISFRERKGVIFFSYHLLLSSVDYVYANAVLDKEGRNTCNSCWDYLLELLFFPMSWIRIGFIVSGSNNLVPCGSSCESRELMTKNAVKIPIFLSKVTYYLSLGLNEGRLSYRRSIQPLKENIQPLKIGIS
jgi:hypothetical protein